MDNENFNQREHEGELKGIKLRAALCNAVIEKYGSCDSCPISKNNSSGLPCKVFMALEPDAIVKISEASLSDIEKMDSDFMKGFKQGIQLTSAICALNEGDCGKCPLAREEDGDTDCLDIMMENPEVISSRIDEMFENYGGVPYNLQLMTEYPIDTLKTIYKSGEGSIIRSYYDEFCTRFPEVIEEVESFSTTVCRDTCFGRDYEDCPGSSEENCTRCWLQPYEEE